VLRFSAKGAIWGRCIGVSAANPSHCHKKENVGSADLLEEGFVADVLANLNELAAPAKSQNLANSGSSGFSYCFMKPNLPVDTRTSTLPSHFSS
jgi:hypothetical protein